MTNHQTQLFSLESPQCFKKRAFAKTNNTKADFNRWIPPAQPAKCHQLTSLKISLGHAFADNHPSMPSMSSEAFTCYRAATSPPSAPALAVTCRRRLKSPLDGATDTNLTAHYDNQFCVIFHFCFYQEAQKRL